MTSIDNQAIANPFNTSQAMILSQTDCPTNPKLGVAYVNGKEVACWGVDTDGSVWLAVSGKNYHITNEQLATNALKYNQAHADIPWQTIVEINNAYQTPAPVYTPPTNTYYYGAGGGYIGRSTTY